MAHQDKVFELFVKKAVANILKEGADKTWGRSNEAKNLKDACDGFLVSFWGFRNFLNFDWAKLLRAYFLVKKR